jgi:glyoxylase-like metal-dependent hydrolase (beta-lactamase superfamily II)
MSFRLLFTVCVLATLFLAGSRPALAAGSQPGSWEVHLISDGESEGSSKLFVGADETLVMKYRPGGAYATAIQYHLVRTPDGKTLLVDTGFGRALVSGLNTQGLKLEDIDAVLLTHMHGDHIGGMLIEGRPAFPRAEVYLAERERAYWTNPVLTEQAAQGKSAGFADAQKVLAAYGSRIRTFEPGELETQGVELLPGIRAAAAYGHTPGHTMYLVGEGDGQLLIWGDLTHAMAMQMPAPRTAMVYDVDPEQAVTTRLRVLQYVSERKLPVAGMHVPATGMGMVGRDGNTGYAFIPMDFEGALGHRERAPSEALLKGVPAERK